MYVERQSLPATVVWPVALFVISVGLGSVVLSLSQQDIHGWEFVLVGFTLFVLALFIWFVFAFRMKTIVGEGTIEVKIWPFKELRLHAEDIGGAELISYSPIAEFGGWGIRYGLGGRMYSASGDKAVKLTLKSGKVVYIGTGKPSQLATVIERLL
jgi:hypothetical protein